MAKITTADVFTQDDILRVKQKLTVFGIKRENSQILRIYRAPRLTAACPLVNEDLPMAKMYMEKYNEKYMKKPMHHSTSEK